MGNICVAVAEVKRSRDIHVATFGGLTVTLLQEQHD